MTTSVKPPTEVVHEVHLPRPHQEQRRFIESPAKRKVIRAGRRGGKTVGMAIYAVQQFLQGRRVLYATPTQEQIDRFWFEVTGALAAPIEAGLYYKNETRHVIELPGTEQRIRAKTAWNADTLRGDYCDLLILDEYQLMDEDAWGLVGAPMMLDTNGDAVFIYTPPSLHSRSVSKARDPQHAAKLFKRAAADTSGRWATFTFTSRDNPHLSSEALDDITVDMTELAYRQEILAEDVDDVPGALWKRECLEATRLHEHPTLTRVVVAVDPAATSGSEADETGIIVAGVVGQGQDAQGYVLADLSLRASPADWARTAVQAYQTYRADRIVGEVNNGGEMVGYTIGTIDPIASYKAVHASRGKQTRAEPIAALYENGRVHHVGHLPYLEEQMATWVPGDKSPDRLDAMVWALTELMLSNAEVWFA